MNGTEETVNKFVTELLDGYAPENGRGKIIHDPVWGTVPYCGWEIQLIDSPLLQRLRDIRQLGMADLTYTAAHHSRFEHSLGTAAVAGRMMENLRRRSREYPITDSDTDTVRLAALLHDVGHCFYSHLSERVYGDDPEFRTLMAEKEVRAAPHEFMSYLIVTSDAFADFFEKHIDFPDKSDVRETLKKAANMIVGKTNYDENGIGLSFLTSVINGEFDADKLDYTQRDSYTAGIAMTYGVDRFLLKLIIHKTVKNGVEDYVLAVESDALTTIEELIFNRSILYVYMYRHQKVLATEAALRDVVLGMKDVGLLSEPAGFLCYTDSDIEGFDTVNKTPFESDNNLIPLGQMIKKIKSRRLPKRVCEYSLERHIPDTVFAGYSALERVKMIVETMNRDPRAVRLKAFELIKNAYLERGKIVDFTLFDIYVSFPAPIKTASGFMLVSKDGTEHFASEKKYIREWAEAFAADKWRGYVFCNANVDKQTAAGALENFVENMIAAST